ncbi:hypothetical protein [Janthinobacterium fluminis]|uniref:PH domain-containing protein n=1 Tax=Janthinobacterium fluminis TaxID=2987524 RepID=A0ABT5JZ61_9BURK|nr:hypothetical protein [Janthinobacterium fluminis]MDC8758012.1 hypothetical protein [Janthinobacterium fluminis]
MSAAHNWKNAMEEDNATAISPSATPLCGKAWTAYAGTAAAALLLAGLLPLAFQFHPLAAGVLALAALPLAYRVLLIRSYRLYYDDVGVWLSSGILPWSRGVAGVKWRDMDEATFEPGFLSWMCRSYTIRIGHRFTKASEITLTSMARGKDVAIAVNARQQELIRKGTVS